jgi:hypothetical protein
LKREGLYDAPINKDAPKGYTAEEMKKIMDEADEKDLGDKLKDYDGDPDGLAEGGRIGFKKGKSKELIDFINKKFGKGTVTTAENMELSPNVLQKKMFEDFNKRNRQLTDEDIQDYELELGDAETWYESGMTVADAEKLVADRKAYEAQMLVDYKAGRLDPKPGENQEIQEEESF